MTHDRILILDFGSQVTQLIARRVREAQVYCEIHPHDVSDEFLRAFGARGIILSGSPASTTFDQPLACSATVFALGIPVLGICYGMQMLAHSLGGDVQSAEHGEFDYVVCMDSLIHYDTQDIANAVEALSQRTKHSILFTFAPHSPLLATMHAMGRLFPRTDRSPQLAPVRQSTLHVYIERAVRQHGWQPKRMQRISSGFYTSQAWEWVKT
jgi:GMP synthase (glutamine-hydrolysing) A subunit